jgi:GTP cyclohydrolase I
MNKDATEKHLMLMLTEGLGLDLTDSDLRGTPERVARMYADEFFANNSGKTPKPRIQLSPNKNYTGIIVRDNIPFVSICAHHLLPFSGVAHLMYIPDKHLVGASKPSRIIQYFAKKPQLQEYLSAEVLDYFCCKVQPLGAMLIIRAVHGCISCRGAKDGNSSGMITSEVRGSFAENLSTRMEGLMLLKTMSPVL